MKQRNHKEQILAVIRGRYRDSEIRERLYEYHEKDIAEIFEQLTQSERDRLLDIMGSEFISQIVVFLDDAGEYLSELETDEAADIIEQMDADEAAEALDELDQQKRSQVFELIEDDEIKEDIERLWQR